MSRSDISPYLIHFTKPVGETEEAFLNLQKIIRDSTLIGSSTFIKGGVSCVCFTEAPAQSMYGRFGNQFGTTSYSPFGIRVTKRWLMDRGGRPVIYQPDSAYSMLPESLKWRHVRYEIGDSLSKQIDFTWEREWRVQCDSLPFNPSFAQIVVPSSCWKHRLLCEHAGVEESLVTDYAQIVGCVQAEGYRSSFPWEIVTLDW